jgi:hypothetical protein
MKSFPYLNNTKKYVQNLKKTPKREKLLWKNLISGEKKTHCGEDISFQSY